MRIVVVAVAPSEQRGRAVPVVVGKPSHQREPHVPQRRAQVDRPRGVGIHVEGLRLLYDQTPARKHQEPRDGHTPPPPRAGRTLPDARAERDDHQTEQRREIELPAGKYAEDGQRRDPVAAGIAQACAGGNARESKRTAARARDQRPDLRGHGAGGDRDGRQHGAHRQEQREQRGRRHGCPRSPRGGLPGQDQARRVRGGSHPRHDPGRSHQGHRSPAGSRLSGERSHAPVKLDPAPLSPRIQRQPHGAHHEPQQAGDRHEHRLVPEQQGSEGQPPLASGPRRLERRHQPRGEHGASHGEYGTGEPAFHANLRAPPARRPSR